MNRDYSIIVNRGHYKTTQQYPPSYIHLQLSVSVEREETQQQVCDSITKCLSEWWTIVIWSFMDLPKSNNIQKCEPTRKNLIVSASINKL